MPICFRDAPPLGCQINLIFGPKKGPPSRSPPCNAVNTKKFLLVLRLDENNIFLGCLRKIELGQKQHFWPPKGYFWPIGAIERPADYLPEKLTYPELPQDMGEI